MDEDEIKMVENEIRMTTEYYECYECYAQKDIAIMIRSNFLSLTRCGVTHIFIVSISLNCIIFIKDKINKLLFLFI